MNEEHHDRPFIQSSRSSPNFPTSHNVSQLVLKLSSLSSGWPDADLGSAGAFVPNFWSSSICCVSLVGEVFVMFWGFAGGHSGHLVFFIWNTSFCYLVLIFILFKGQFPYFSFSGCSPLILLLFHNSAPRRPRRQPLLPTHTTPQDFFA